MESKLFLWKSSYCYPVIMLGTPRHPASFNYVELCVYYPRGIIVSYEIAAVSAISSPVCPEVLVYSEEEKPRHGPGSSRTGWQGLQGLGVREDWGEEGGAMGGWGQRQVSKLWRGPGHLGWDYLPASPWECSCCPHSSMAQRVYFTGWNCHCHGRATALGQCTVFSVLPPLQAVGMTFPSHLLLSSHMLPATHQWCQEAWMPTMLPRGNTNFGWLHLWKKEHLLVSLERQAIQPWQEHFRAPNNSTTKIKWNLILSMKARIWFIANL